jgi:hypothetical protein
LSSPQIVLIIAVSIALLVANAHLREIVGTGMREIEDPC